MIRFFKHNNKEKISTPLTLKFSSTEQTPIFFIYVLTLNTGLIDWGSGFKKDGIVYERWIENKQTKNKVKGGKLDTTFKRQDKEKKRYQWHLYNYTYELFQIYLHLR